MRKIVGYGILLAIFSGIFAAMAAENGAKFALVVFGGSFSLVALVFLAIWLIEY